MSRLIELLQRRRELKSRLDALAGELEAVDRLLFARMQKLAEAVEGSGGSLHLAAFENKSRELENLRARVRDMKTLHMTPPAAGAPQRRVSQSPLEIALSREDIDESGLDSVNLATADVYSGNTGAQSGLAHSLRYLVPAVTAILEEAGAPMRTSAIYRALLDRGLAMPGKNPINNLSAHLSNRDAFLSTSEGWVLRTPALIKAEEATSDSNLPQGNERRWPAQKA